MKTNRVASFEDLVATRYGAGSPRPARMTGTTEDLLAVHASPDNQHVWAGGYNGALLHLVGQTWEAVPPPSAASPNSAIWGTSPNDLFACPLAFISLFPGSPWSPRAPFAVRGGCRQPGRRAVVGMSVAKRLAPRLDDMGRRVRASARALETARHQGSIAFELRTTLSMCKNSLCGVQELQPLLERMVGTSEDQDLREARKMLALAF